MRGSVSDAWGTYTWLVAWERRVKQTQRIGSVVPGEALCRVLAANMGVSGALDRGLSPD